jgi:hypothetical protein
MDEPFDPLAAANLLQHTASQTRRAFDVRAHLMYAGWGTAWLLGLGGMWLSVRGQHPYQGPSALAFAVLAVLIAAALVVNAALVRATRGIEGPSAIQGRIFGLAWAVGFGTYFAVQGAVARQGASLETLGVLGATGPLLITSLVYLTGAAIWLDRTMGVLAVWLAVVAGAAAFTGPVAVLLVEAIAGGGALLAAAGYLSLRRRS